MKSLTILAGVCLAAALTGCSSSSNQRLSLRAWQAADDMKSFHLDQVEPTGKAAWVVAEVKIDKASGAIPGAYIDETGFHEPPHAQMVIRHVGTCRIIAVLSGTPPAMDGPFQWDEPAPMMMAWSASPPPDSQKPSRSFSDGLYILDLDGTFADEDSFQRSYALPAGWAGQVKPAVEFYHASRGLFETPYDAGKQDRLKQLASGDNPFLALAAMRQLAGAHAADKAFMRGLLEKSRADLQALLLLTYLDHADAALIVATRAAVLKLIDEAPDAAAVQGLSEAAEFMCFARTKEMTAMAWSIADAGKRNPCVWYDLSQAGRWNRRWAGYVLTPWHEKMLRDLQREKQPGWSP